MSIDVSEGNENISTSTTSRKSRRTSIDLLKICFICNNKYCSDNNNYNKSESKVSENRSKLRVNYDFPPNVHSRKSDETSTFCAMNVATTDELIAPDISMQNSE